MKTTLQLITDRVATKKGALLTVFVWLAMIALLTAIAPNAKDYEVNSLDTLPEKAQSVIAKNKIDKHFEDSDGIPAILVFENDKTIKIDELTNALEFINKDEVKGLKEILPLDILPEQVALTFFSEDEKAAIIPLSFDSNLDTKDIKVNLNNINNIIEEQSNLTLHITGPAGISVDTTDLFSRADLVLMFSTVGIILLLLIITYRSPLLALIPLLAAGIVYGIVNQILGFIGKAGIELATQSMSIMMILLFAVVIDYSLFIFSRFHEELKQHESKYDAMKLAMHGIGTPIFYSSSTIIIAMLLLLFTKFGDYQNFAPIFGTAVFVVMISAITLIPALFTIFGRSSFWPRIPRVGDNQVKSSSLWSSVGKFVTKKPIISASVVGVFLLICALNIFNMTYEFDTMKSFPDDMPSRVGYDVLEEKFEKGDLAPTTALYESTEKITEDKHKIIEDILSEHKDVSYARLTNLSEDEKVASFDLVFNEGPFDIETIDTLEELIDNGEQLIKENNLGGSFYFAGETASAIDDRSTNNRDLIVIVILETIFIFGMLIFLTRSFKMPIFMMGTILVSFLAALGLGIFLTNILFDIDTVSNRVPVYSFIFLVALGIDYNIFLVSRYLEERKKYPVKKAVEIAVSHTGGVISSAGIILAATFAVLMTQPMQILFVFGFIVAIGILLDTFLIRGVLMPSLLVLFEKDKK